jgi:hypothetical protein
MHLPGEERLPPVCETVEGDERDVHAAVVGEEIHHTLCSLVGAQADQEHP